MSLNSTTERGGGGTEGCMGEQATLELDLTFDDVLLHKLVQAYIS